MFTLSLSSLKIFSRFNESRLSDELREALGFFRDYDWAGRPEVYDEVGSNIQFALDADSSAHAFNQILADAQPKADTVGVARLVFIQLVEVDEQLFLCAFRHAAALVWDDDAEVRVIRVVCVCAIHQLCLGFLPLLFNALHLFLDELVDN